MAPVILSKRSGSLHAQVVDTLGQEIVDGRIATGEVLSPNELCDRFGVSRSVVRESLRALESMGMIVARSQVGTKVLPFREWNLLDPQIVEWRGRGEGYSDQMEEVLEMRFGVELVAARLAVRRMRDNDVTRLLACADEMTRAAEGENGSAYLRADAEFHRLILEGSGNALVAQFSQTVTAVLQTRERDRRQAINDLTLSSLEDHHRLVRAIRARDADEAETAIRAVVAHTLVEFQSLRGLAEGI